MQKSFLILHTSFENSTTRIAIVRRSQNNSCSNAKGPGAFNNYCTRLFKSEGRGGFSQLPKMSAEKTILGFKNENSDFFFAFTDVIH